MTPSDNILHACPNDVNLGRFHARELSLDEEASIQLHLESCEACAARSARLVAAHDTWVERIRAVGAPPPRVTDAPPVDDGLVGSEVPGYEIREEIRRGGQGIVYRAFQQSTKREVAIKVLREGRFASGSARRRFEREIELVAGLRHPHIVTVFDSGRTADGRPFLVMDFVRGERLDTFVSRQATTAALPTARTKQPQDAVLALFARVCEAVNYAHQRGIIHRDLKPSNILVDEDGQPHVLDFGLAREVNNADARVMTMSGQVAGTLAYMSPEQARGLPDAIDIRSDVYALGVLLYEMISGRHPYPVDGDTIEVLRHIAETEPAAIDGAGDELATVIRKALAKERERRYQTAGDLARDIEHLRVGEAIEAKRDSGWYLLRKTVRRYRTAVAVVGAFVTLVAASAVTFGVMYARQVRLSEEANQQAEIARNAEAVAQKRFQDVRDLANVFTLQLDGLIKRLPGSAPARETIVENGLRYLDALAAERADDPELQLEAAAAYMTMGDVQGELEASSLGDLGGARESYRKAIQILETIIEQNPDNPTAPVLLMLALLKESDALSRQGHAADAEAAVTRTIQIGDRLRSEGVDSAPIRAHLSAAHSRAARFCQTRGDLDGSIRHHEQGMRLAQQAADDERSAVEQLHNQGAAVSRIAQIHYARRELDAALERYKEFLAIANQAREAAPDDVVPRRDQGIAHQWIGIIHSDMKNLEPAAESFHASIKVLDELLAVAPDDVEARNTQVANFIRLGEVSLAQEQIDRAQTCFERVVRDSEALARQQPDLAAVLRNQGVAYYKMMELQQAIAKDPATPEAHRRAHREAACDWLSRCRDLFADMRDRGVLSPADAAVPDELTSELDACRKALDPLPPPGSSD